MYFLFFVTSLLSSQVLSSDTSFYVTLKLNTTACHFDSVISAQWKSRKEVALIRQ